jgi:putative membrane protein
MAGRAVVMGWLTMVMAGCVPAHPGLSDVSDYTETPLEYHLHVYGRAGEVTQDDRYFVFRAGVADLYEIALADLARTRATSAALEEFALRRRADAVADHQRLSLIADQHIGIPAPAMLDREHAFARDQMATLSGTAFEDAYLRDALRRDEAALALYTQQARFGGEPVLMRLAAEGVPRLAEEKDRAMRMMAALPR